MSNDPAPKPRNCPFCGNAPYVKHFNPHDDEPSTAIGCDALGCPAKPSMNKGSYEDTLAAWNGRRPNPETQVVAPVEAVPSQQSAEPVAWMWQYIGNDPMTDQIKPCARSLHEMDPHKPPYPDKWRPEYPLFAASPGPSELVEEMEGLVQELREKRDRNGTTGYAAGLHECADRFSALITRHRGKS